MKYKEFLCFPFALTYFLLDVLKDFGLHKSLFCQTIYALLFRDTTNNLQFFNTIFCLVIDSIKCSTSLIYFFISIVCKNKKGLPSVTGVVECTLDTEGSRPL